MVTELFTVDGEIWARCADGTIRKRRKFYLNSTDEKPTDGVKDVDSCYEKDTGKLFLYDEDTGTWMEQ